MSKLILGYEIPAGHKPRAPGSGGGPQVEGVAYCKVKATKEDKKKAIQVKLECVAINPDPRKDETFTAWINVMPKSGAKPNFAKVCRDNVATLIGSAGVAAYDQDEEVLTSAIPKGFDLLDFLNNPDRVLAIYTKPGDEEYHPEVVPISRGRAKRIEAGTEELNLSRQKKRNQAMQGKSMGASGGIGGGGADPFADGGSEVSTSAGTASADPFA